MWNDAGTYDAVTRTGGANGSIMNSPLIENNDEYPELAKAALQCGVLKDTYPDLTYADIIQLAGVVAVEATGGPIVDFVPGRKDSSASPEPGQIPAERGGRYLIPYNMVAFDRLGLSSKEIVALSGGLFLGRREQRKFRVRDVFYITVPLKFDNSYFRRLAGLLLLDIDWERKITRWDKPVLITHNRFRRVLRYAMDQNAFFSNYAKAHKKFSELGFTPENSTTGISELGVTPENSTTGISELGSAPENSTTGISELEVTPEKSITELVQQFVAPAIATVMVAVCYFYQFHRRV